MKNEIKMATSCKEANKQLESYMFNKVIKRLETSTLHVQTQVMSRIGNAYPIKFILDPASRKHKNSPIVLFGAG